MCEAWIEPGIGETRAIVVADGRIVEAHIERPGAWRAGDVRAVRLVTVLVPGVRGIVADGAVEALLTPLPPRLTEGAMMRVAVVREAGFEPGRVRLARVVASDAPIGPGPSLAQRLAARGLALRTPSPIGHDVLEDFGWSEALDAARTGRVRFAGGSLTISPTPAMTVIDVDGDLPLADLALAAADAVGAAVRRFDLAGSIGVDFPTVGDRAVRQAIGAHLDAVLPPPFERTAVNGFGFVQIVRPKLRPSLVDLLRGDPVAAAALALLRRAEREPPGPCRLVTASAVAHWLEQRVDLTAELARRRGGGVTLSADPHLTLEASRVEATP